jgi:hypothetical protein
MMHRKMIPIAMGTIGVLAIASGAIASNPNQQYSDSRLTPAKANVLGHLAWPQSYAAVTNRLGYPMDRDQYADYYVTSDGRKVTIGYANGYAVYGFVEGL